MEGGTRMARAVSWGVLSTAKIGTEKVIPAMQRGALSRIDAIASRDIARGRDVAERLGIPKVYGSYEDLLADPAIEAVYNPLPNHLHVPWTIKAMEAGKHVLCEKPIALSAAEAAEVVETRERTGRHVAEAFMVRHHPQWQMAREIARSGRLGEVRAIQTFFSHYLTDPSNIRNQADIGGGGLYDIGCYAILTARYIFGAEPLRAIGLMDRDQALKTDRLTSGLVEFPGGRQLTFVCSTQLVPHQRVQIVGTKGRVEVQIPFNPRPDAATRVLVDDGRDLTGSGITVEEIPPGDQYTFQGDEFSRVVLGEKQPDWPLEDAVANMRVIDAIFRSVASERWEALER
jgi:predicted dehydrogenase